MALCSRDQAPASSNLNGWSEIGFAFGISPPMAIRQAGHFSPHTVSGDAVAGACSASCYLEDVRILAVIVQSENSAT